MKTNNSLRGASKIRHFEKFPESIDHMLHYYFEIAPEIDNDLQIVSGGFERCNSKYEIRRNSHPYFVIELVTKGRLQLKIKNKKHLLEPGVIAGFAPGVPHHYKCEESKTIEHYYITFLGNDADKFFRLSSLDRCGAIRLLNYANTLYLMERIYKIATTERGPNSHNLCCCYLKAMLLEHTVNVGTRKGDICASLQTFTECKQYIDANFCAIFSISEVAEICNIDSKYMSKLFKRHVGLSPSEYIRRLKLNKAASIILQMPNLSIKQVAATVGYEDPFYFSRIFSKLYGICPKTYKHLYTQLTPSRDS